MPKNITITDIAKACNVSVSTVSRVLNNSPSVAAKKRDAILAFIEEHNYHPSMAARSMVSKTSHLIGVIVPDITNPYFSSLMEEIETIATNQHFTVIFSNMMTAKSAVGSASEQIERQTFNMLLERRVDGIIVLGGEIDKEAISEQHIKFLNTINKRTPIIMVAQKHPHCTCTFIERNLALGVTLLTNHLLALNKKNIAFFGGEQFVTVTSERVQTFKKQMLLYTNNAEPLIVLSDYYASDGYESMQTFLKEHKNTLPEAIIAINDSVALGIIRALNDAGVRVPDDIAVASCDAFPQSEYYTPRLTTVDQKNTTLGDIAIRSLLKSIEHEEYTAEIDAFQHIPDLLIRESCGATKNIGGNYERK
jgi:Transcriptional regulators